MSSELEWSAARLLFEYARSQGERRTRGRMKSILKRRIEMFMRRVRRVGGE